MSERKLLFSRFASFRRRPESINLLNFMDPGLGFGLLRRPAAYAHIGVRRDDGKWSFLSSAEYEI
ncbi:MAG: hypothetical protein KAS48_01030 [Gammaproteobacteria bacterium]|nr:hypothetical protein [Gammaproteobacteria bacterium]